MLDHEYATMRRVEDGHWWYRTLRTRVRLDLEKHLSKSSAQVLDAGCGTGGMLAHIRSAGRRGWELAGIDLSPLAVACCQERGLLNVQAADASTLPFADAQFDAVMSLDVLVCEGLDDMRAISECARVTRPGGLTVINCAAYDVLRGGHDRAVRGVRRYTPKRVRKLLEAQGLQVLELHAWNAWAFLPVLVWRILSRFRNPQTPDASRSDLFRLPDWMESILARVASLDFCICRWLHFPLGTSIYAVAMKPPTRPDVESPA